LTRVDGHAVLLNALAMQRLEIDPTSGDPPGGRYLRQTDGGPTGVLIDRAISAVEERLPRSTFAERKRRLLLAARHCLALGLTTVTEMGVGVETCRAYEELRGAEELPLRVSLFLGDDQDLVTHWFERGPRLDSKARLQIRGVKLFADGALGSRGAALLEPYSDEAGHLGLPQASSEEIATVCGAALESGFQAAVHAIGDLGGRLVLDGFERAFGGPRPAARFRLEHAQVLEPAEFSRMARLGVIASMQPSHATSDMSWVEERLGAQRLAGAYAWRSVLQAGGRLALGSDFPIEPADPRRGLHAAVTRQDPHGQPRGGWRPEERLTRHEALRGFTLDAAYSLFLDGELGSLAAGKRADLVVFERDIMVVPANEILTVGVDLTVLEGKVVFRREAAS
jgi:predicted amidohydrolase YtcJ